MLCTWPGSIIKSNGESIKCHIIKEDSLNLHFEIEKDGNTIPTFIQKDKVKSFAYNTSLRKYNFLNDSTDMKKQKRVAIEMNFKPFNADEIISLDNHQLKCLLNQEMAFRLGLYFDYTNNEQDKDDWEDQAANKATFSESTYEFGFIPGLEFKFLDHSKFVPYWGVELPVFIKRSQGEYTEYSNGLYNEGAGEITVIKTEGALMSIESENIKDIYTGGTRFTYRSYLKERAYTSLGFNLLLGADYNFLNNLYVGFEIGVGYKMIFNKPVSVNINGEDKEIKEPGNKNVDFGFYYNPSLRLGIRF